jgi:hypothetical protein
MCLLLLLLDSNLIKCLLMSLLLLVKTFPHDLLVITYLLKRVHIFLPQHAQFDCQLVDAGLCFL